MANRERLIDYAQSKIGHASDIIDMLMSRIKYGVPIVLQEKEYASKKHR
ncbi:MAG: hypothetical protein QXV17_11785 [Candidatus Micrarchaeaceae archaeon]